ncbi:polyhomeotic-like protein 2 [Periophthalmus magnuspinnatus]|uniref:polyhomeotic-like protein 2 n=1 Tax=Periophthalmus magnuspinnatus TaxID=409849 RepID=UPI00145BA2E3|nr:polyhomeotic-like protein 2 [Periophthalmus magnuspinnatus]
MTSGSGSSQHSGERKPEQPPSKSHILTHLIEGFVIQEGNTPFPLERPSFSVDCLSLRRHRGDMKTDCLPLKELRLQEPMLTCELCGKVDFASAFKRSKRFCSTVCAKRYSVGCSKRVGLFPNAKASIESIKRQRENTALRSSPQESRRRKPVPASCHSPQPAQGESSQCADLPYPGASSPLSPHTSPSQHLHVGSSALPHGLLPSDPGQWNVDHVYDFIRSLPGCLDIAEEFRSQEIDGQALLLLKEDHLMGTMNIKLGPALKIFAQISLLKDS